MILFLLIVYPLSAQNGIDNTKNDSEIVLTREFATDCIDCFQRTIKLDDEKEAFKQLYIESEEQCLIDKKNQAEAYQLQYKKKPSKFWKGFLIGLGIASSFLGVVIISK